MHLNRPLPRLVGLLALIAALLSTSLVAQAQISGDVVKCEDDAEKAVTLELTQLTDAQTVGHSSAAGVPGASERLQALATGFQVCTRTMDEVIQESVAELESLHYDDPTFNLATAIQPFYDEQAVDFQEITALQDAQRESADWLAHLQQAVASANTSRHAAWAAIGSPPPA